MTLVSRRRFGAFVLTLGALVSACSSSSTPAGQAGAGATPTTRAPTAPASVATNFPVTVSTPGGTLTVKALPVAIVSLSPTATEMLFAIGAGKQVIAVDDQSNYPADAPKTDLSGFQPNVEAIAAKKPDLVVISDNGAKLTDSLGALNIPVLLLPPATTFDDMYGQLEALGTAVGKGNEAKGVADQMRANIKELVAKVPAKPVKIFHEVDTTLYSASSASFIGQVYALFGVENIADAADKDKTGYPQLNNEYVVQANPQVIFLSDGVFEKQDASTVAGRAGWADIDAVKTKRVVILDPDTSSRWGPRVVSFVQTIADTLGKV